MMFISEMRFKLEEEGISYRPACRTKAFPQPILIVDRRQWLGNLFVNLEGVKVGHFLSDICQSITCQVLSYDHYGTIETVELGRRNFHLLCYEFPPHFGDGY